jgi:hypothetical protein
MPCNGIYFDNWAEHVPDDDDAARITDYAEVTNAFVVHITNGSYRLANFSGVFEIADRNKIWDNKGGLQKIICKVYWFCHRPPTKFPSIIVTEGNFRFEENYTGKVVRNIGK